MNRSAPLGNTLLPVSAARCCKTDHATAAMIASDCRRLPPSPRLAVGESDHPYPVGSPGPVAASGRHQHTDVAGMRLAPNADNLPLQPHASPSRPPRSSSVPAAPHASDVGAPGSTVTAQVLRISWFHYHCR
jgi:hypothetical protein